MLNFAEQFIRTSRNKVNKYMTLIFDILNDILHEYNNTCDRAIQNEAC